MNSIGNLKSSEGNAMNIWRCGSSSNVA